MSARVTLLRVWPDGRDVVNAGELQAVAALLGSAAAEEEARALVGELHGRPLTSAALQMGNARAIVEALRWEGATPPPAETIAARAALEAHAWGEPLAVDLDTAGPEEIRDQVLTVDGWMRLEDDYIPRVITGEHGHAHPAALRAQAIAARTYVLRAMRDHRALGRTVPIKNSETFQVYARGAFKTCIAATEATRGIVARYGGRLIVCNFVAGALWTHGKPGADPTRTERFVTYNAGRTGRYVVPTGLADKTRTDNRGCMSQNAADWLARHGYEHPAILRYFYGDDLELGPVSLSGGASSGPTWTPYEHADPDDASAAPASVLPGVAAVALLNWFLG